RDEALAKAIGDAGERLSRSKKEQFKAWLNRFWNSVKNIVGKGIPEIENMSSKDIRNMTLGELSDVMAKRIGSGKALENNPSLKEFGEIGQKVKPEDTRFMVDNSPLLRKEDFIRDSNGKIIGVKASVKKE